LIGGVIGYITNYIAIKMLFRPRTAVYIGKLRLPFTPGVVPRRKDELADILGNAIVAKFFNADDLEIVFTSDYLRDAFADGIADILLSDSVAPRDFTASADDAARLDSAAVSVKEELCVRILAGVLKSEPASVLARACAARMRRRFRGGAAEKLGDEIMASVAEALSEELEAYILSDGRDILMPLLDAELEEAARTPLGVMTKAVFKDKDSLVRLARDIYARFMRAYVRPIVSTIDVGGIIAEKIKHMDAIDIEGLVLSVVKKELRYLIWLGALLGVIIGTANIFI
jgi:uncharacterized membrane protein YheB (UPF0754 family)